MTAVDSSAPTVAAPSGAPPETSAAIQVRDLWKRYGRVEAVRGLSLDIRPGEIFGLIGPDGAGKTSTFQMLSGVMEPTSGSISVLGHSAQAGRAYVGYLTQAFSLYQDLTVHENLRYIGAMRNLTDAQIDARGLHYLSLFGMERFLSRQAGRLSGGMKQKLALACALVAAPQVLLLDEPTTGVDPVSRREFWDSLADLSAGGMTIVVATPYLDEAERCTRVALMYDGMIHELGTPAELRSALGLKRLEVSTPDLRATERALREAGRPDMSPSSGVTNVEAPLGSPESAPGPAANIVDVQRFGDRLDVMVKDPRAGEQQVRQILQAARISLTSLRIAPPTLENVFVATLRAQHPEEAQSSTQGVEIGARKHAAQPLNGDAAPIAIGARDLVKSFGDFHAVKNIDLGIRYGEIYGLLGANGAGKTTTIKMLCGLLAPTSGEITLAGEAGAARSPAVRQRVGYMSQKFSLYDDLSIDENLEFFGGIYGVPPAMRPRKKQWILEFAGLIGRGKMLTGELPGGWKQRVAFGAAIMHEPSVLFLDEPTSGVDPIARRAFWEVINELADQGVAVLITTHYLEEAEQCNRLGMMVAGELVTEGTPRSVKAAQGGHLLNLHTDQPQRASNFLKTRMDRWRVSLFGDQLHVIVDESPEVGIPNVTRTLAELGIRVLDAEEQPYSLEDVFISVVEKAREQGKAAVEE
jgi:ABC-2 type transport system ATP-binding protein